MAGSAKLTQWTGKDGADKHAISITVQSVMSMYQARKRKREVEEV